MFQEEVFLRRRERMVLRALHLALPLRLATYHARPSQDRCPLHPRGLSAESLACGAMAGAVFESFAVSEILKSFSNAGLEYRYFVSYYRGRDKIAVQRDGQMVETECEIDLVIEENGVLYPIEIKKSSSPKASDAAAFVALDKIKGKKRGQGAAARNRDKSPRQIFGDMTKSCCALSRGT